MSRSARIERGPSEADRRELYHAGYGYAVRRLVDGETVDAVREGFAALAASYSRPFSPETLLGIEDALAGRPIRWPPPDGGSTSPRGDGLGRSTLPARTSSAACSPVERPER